MVSEELLKQKAMEDYAKNTNKNIVEVKRMVASKKSNATTKTTNTGLSELQYQQEQTVLETLKLANNVIQEQQNIIRHYEQLITLIMTSCDSE